MDLAFNKLKERRKIISAALKQQKQIANMNRRKALLELERQKTLLAVEDGVRLHGLNDKTERKPNAGNLQVGKINQRIISRFQAIKKKRQQESSEFEEEEKSNFKELQDEQDQSVKRPTRAESLETEIDRKLQLAITSPLLNLKSSEKKAALQWLDFKRNAAILEKTDQAIEDKLKAKNAVLPFDDLGVLYLDKEHVFNENERDLGFNKHEEENPAHVSWKCM